LGQSLNKKYVFFANVKQAKDKKFRRKTIMIDAFNHYKLQQLQAKLIEKTSSSVSFSYVVVEVLRRHYHIGR